MNYHLQALGGGQQRILHRAGRIISQAGFYLGGGTAVALHLGHRRSQDLDWFTADKFPDPAGLARVLAEQGIPFQTAQVERGTLHGTISGVRVSFLEYRYPLLKPLNEWSRFGCRISSPEDLAAMKLSAIAQRGSKKDFVDVYALDRKLLPLARMLRLYQQKYSLSDIGHVLFGLADFDEANRERMPQMLWKKDWKTIQRTLHKRLDDLV